MNRYEHGEKISEGLQKPHFGSLLGHNTWVNHTWVTAWAHDN